MTTQYIRHEIITLHYIYPLSLPKLRILLQFFPQISEIQNTNSEFLAKVLGIPQNRASKIKKLFQEYLQLPFEKIYKEKGIEVVLYNDSNYPKELLKLADPPVVLYIFGKIQLLSQPKIAIIGSRGATTYSEKALQYIVPPLVKANYCIVSGMAKGADTMAHKAAIQYNGQTIAVLGTGLDYIYPKQNEQLFHYMKEHQCIVTEFPPYFGPKKWQFPMRNRIISGLSHALVVTEAAMKSGTLITTEFALEQGKDVFVVPGPIDSPQCMGTNHLLKEGAIPVTNGYQIVDEMSLFHR